MRQPSIMRRSDLLAMALVLGVAGGLFEGVVHMALQPFVLENVWYQILWIAPAFNGLFLCAVAIALWPALSIRAVQERGRSALMFCVVFAAWLPCIALLLKTWIHPAALFVLAIGTSVAATRALASRGQQALVRFRRSVPAALGAWCLCVVAVQGGLELRERALTSRLPAPAPGSPDVLLVIVDTLRADHVSSYGYGSATTPNLDRLAAEGALFERAFSTSSWTLPAHVSMLSGLLPHEHGVEWLSSKRWQSTSYRLLPEMLQERGYRTAAFSGNTYWVSREHGFGRGFLHFEDFFHSPVDMAVRTAYGRIAATLLFPRLGIRDMPGRKRAEDTNRALLDWMRRDPDRPAFVMVNYFDVHDPYMPRGEYAAAGAPRGLINSVFGTPDRLTPDELRAEVAAYDGALRYVDAQLGELMAALRQRQAGRDLIVVVTSDHGEEFEEHGGYGHGHHVYRETVHVPLVLWQPGTIPAGTRVGVPVSIASIPASLLDLLGIEAPGGVVPSLRALWSADPPDAWPDPIVWLAQRPWLEDSAPVRHGAMRSLVRAPWQFIDHDAFGPELYDLERDPAEQQNLARDDRHRALVRDLEGQLDRLAARGHAAASDSRDSRTLPPPSP